MSTELTNTSKLREFVEELKRLKVEIIRPSINKCFAEFKAIDGKLFYGLGAIKNVGFEAISNIIKDREKNGKFNSLSDLISRLNSKDVNKLQLEGLTKAGAFDEFDKDRSKIFNSIPKIIQQIKSNNEERNNNQTSLFSNTENSNDYFQFLNSTPWKQKELLAEEFNSLGFYISDHPLNEYADIFNQLEIIPYQKFYENNLNEGTVAGTIMSIQEKKVQKVLLMLLLSLVIKSVNLNYFYFQKY